MIEGKIIKFHRELQGLNQAELGNGICSKTHISKIERGLTEVSKETIEMLAERLQIDMAAEIDTYLSLDLLLKEWHESIILKLNAKARSIKEQLESIVLLQIPDFYRSKTLVLARYYMSIDEDAKARSLIKEMDSWIDLSSFDQNMLLHIKGEYCLKYKKDYTKAIAFLKRIDLTYYNNAEYYYHLAIAYHHTNSRVLAYYYATKALDFFTSKHSFTRIIETEMLMLIQVEQEEYFDPKESGYPRLIEMADSLGLEYQKTQLLHNYAYQQFRYGDYEKAFEYYSKALKLIEPNNSQYLISLEGYLNAATKLGKMTEAELLRIANEGISLSEKISDTMSKHYFHLHIYKITNDVKQYYQYLESELYPSLKKAGYGLAAETYEIKLFDFYSEKGDIEQAYKYAAPMMDKHRKNSELV
ncbi:helix-turn-helix domain-containing protein [Sporosarcina highlanderae]|uniref:Helix-turn-helix transcriptional regulator n=1 Tax=Sporosarcina highlanderae TaxID=3035916 RepID=A0ABT8JSC0_9BACL|nr:helix-turn-helix transcriptional regulator [Sporosarcina highlanderae]MDN4608066.1 helix-turn-helix transcriptional regulator [Sporosarcina highlanderae]